ncbi:MAG: F0F1 ATP synthase subunit delta [Neomegalonema sp.]|nr:F0F1 ATP synthase subunit delta [Neomegalonema sp.]
MSDTANIVSGVAGRYATALFELADESGALDAVSADIAALGSALSDQPEIARALADQSASRGELKGAILGIAEKMGFNSLTTNTLALMAEKRRLSVLPGMTSAFGALAAAKRGEVTAFVTTAEPLSDGQIQKLSASLAKSAGKTVHMSVEVDPDLIGGLVVKMGSTMIDASVRSKLSKLQHAMKEAS